jgi:diamine N-acetyltransferase
MITVSKVGIESINTIRSLAEHIWKVSYASILSPDQVIYMLDLFYSEASLQKQMDEGHQFILAKENSASKGLNTSTEYSGAVGFASYSRYERPHLETGTAPHQKNVYRLHKIYIDPSLQGKGIGKLLIGFIINDISLDNATELELNVNRNNKALDFYQKIGFKIIKEEDIDIGNGYFMNDYVMELALS